MKIDPVKKSIWMPRRDIQKEMTVEEKEVDNYCRAVLGVLNKVTPQNIDRLLDRVVRLCMNNEFNIRKLVHYVIRKAIDEPIYSEVYANFCCCLTSEAREDSISDNCKLFKGLLLEECEERFRDIFIDTSDWKDNVRRVTDDVEEDGEYLFEYRHRMFGMIIFIGHLYNVEFLPEELLRQYITRLLDGEYIGSPEFRIECICKLLWIVGSQLDMEEKKEELDEYMSKIDKLRSENHFCSRVKFAVLDIVELRENNWVARRFTESPTTIDEIRHSCSAKYSNAKKKKKKKIKENKENKSP